MVVIIFVMLETESSSSSWRFFPEWHAFRIICLLGNTVWLNIKVYETRQFETRAVLSSLDEVGVWGPSRWDRGPWPHCLVPFPYCTWVPVSRSYFWSQPHISTPAVYVKSDLCLHPPAPVLPAQSPSLENMLTGPFCIPCHSGVI